MKYERLKQLVGQAQLSIKEMREKDQLINELLPLMMEVVSSGKDLEIACLWLNQGGSRETLAATCNSFADAFEALEEV